jgi:hypothetical protein
VTLVAVRPEYEGGATARQHEGPAKHEGQRSARGCLRPRERQVGGLRSVGSARGSRGRGCGVVRKSSRYIGLMMVADCFASGRPCCGGARPGGGGGVSVMPCPGGGGGGDGGGGDARGGGGGVRSSVGSEGGGGVTGPVRTVIAAAPFAVSLRCLGDTEPTRVRGSDTPPHRAAT